MIMLLLLINGILDVHGMTGGGTGYGPVPGKGKTIAVHLRLHADTVTEPQTVALLAESHMIGTEFPFRSAGSEEACQLLLGKYMADPATFRVSMGIDGGICGLRIGCSCYRKNQQRHKRHNT